MSWKENEWFIQNNLYPYYYDKHSSGLNNYSYQPFYPPLYPPYPVYPPLPLYSRPLPPIFLRW